MGSLSLSLMFLLICQGGLFSLVYSSNMNGDIYGISNPNISSPKQFSTKFQEINDFCNFREVRKLYKSLCFYVLFQDHENTQIKLKR